MHWLTILADRGRIRKAVTLSWDGLTAFFSNPIAETKDEIPLVVGTQFRVIDEEWRRRKSFCIGRTVVPLDYDDPSFGFDDLVKELRRLDLRAIVHTTASHTEASPRLRAFVELDRVVTPTEWDSKIKPWMRGTMRQDPNALDITRVTYAPMRIKGYRCEAT